MASFEESFLAGEADDDDATTFTAFDDLDDFESKHLDDADADDEASDSFNARIEEAEFNEVVSSMTDPRTEHALVQEFKSFEEVLSKCVAITKERAEALFDEARRYPLVGPSVSKSIKRVRMQKDGEQLRDERDTWLLLQHLLAHQLHKTSYQNSDVHRRRELSQKTLVTTFLKDVDVDEFTGFRSAPLHRQWTIVNWLCALAAEQADQNTTQLTYFDSFERGAVQEGSVTVDALVHGELLSETDEQKERVLLEAVWRQLRAGNSVRAIQILQQEQQHWRAASLAGYNWYCDPRLDNTRDDDDDDGSWQNRNDDDDDKDYNRGNTTTNATHNNKNSNVSAAFGLPSGTVSRPMWKKVCEAISEKQSLGEYERAIYGLMAGNAKQVLPLCPTWHDQLWLHLSLFIDKAIDLLLKEYDNDTTFSSSSSSSSSSSAEQSLHLYQNPFGHDLRSTRLSSIGAALSGPVGSVEDIFQLLSNSENKNIERQAASVFSVVQRELILDNRPRLLDLLCEWVTAAEETLERGCVKWVPVHSPSLRRFAAHLAVFWNRFHPLSEEEQRQTRHEDWHTVLVQAYIDDLVDNQQIRIVANYACLLPTEQAQVHAYAGLLTHLTLLNQRVPFRECHELAARYDLPVEKIAKLAARRIDEAADDPERQRQFPSPWTREPGLPAEDAVRIDAVRWMWYDPAMYAEGLLRANRLARRFLLQNKFEAAALLVATVPSDVAVAMPPPSCFADRHFKEFLGIRAFLEARHFYNKWLADQTEPTDRPRNAILRILESPHGWLLDRDDDTSSVFDEQADARQQQCTALRGEFIPELSFWLVEIHVQEGDFTGAVAVADIIADKVRRLYKCFRPVTLQVFLARIRDVVMLQLQQGCPDPLGHYSSE